MPELGEHYFLFSCILESLTPCMQTAEIAAQRKRSGARPTGPHHLQVRSIQRVIIIINARAKKKAVSVLPAI